MRDVTHSVDATDVCMGNKVFEYKSCYHLEPRTILAFDSAALRSTFRARTEPVGLSSISVLISPRDIGYLLAGTQSIVL
jgi:hypothetical protein